MTISAAATVSPRPCKIPMQYQVCHDCPHHNTACNLPAAWCCQIHRILQEIAPFLQCKFCYTAAIAMSRREDGNLQHVIFLVFITACIALNHFLIDAFNVVPFCVVGWTVHQASMVMFHHPKYRI